MSEQSIFTSAKGLTYSSQHNKYNIVTVQAGQQSFVGRAPITGIKIGQSVDFSITKTLDGGFFMSIFQDRPISIVISGLQNMVADACKVSQTQSGIYVDAFYSKYKASSKQASFITLTLGSSANASQTFKGYLVSMVQQADSVDMYKAAAGVMSYTLNLIGVRV